MKPLDPRLLRYARSSRAYLAATAALGFLKALAIIGFAWFAAGAVAALVHGAPLASVAGQLAALAGAVAARSALQWGIDALSARAAANAKAELRGGVIEAIAAGRVDADAPGRSSAELTTLATHGLDALDGYFGKYLPQLVFVAVMMPPIVAAMLLADPVSGITVIVTMPIIPVFMALIGWATQRVQDRQWHALTTLATRFLEIVEGLSTLKIFGRAERQRRRVAEITDAYRRATMRVIRLSFVSGFALELFASLAVALVAVQIGIRMVEGDFPLATGLFVLILAPDAFAPLRQVGAQFHASAEGVAAADEAFAVIETARAPQDRAEDAGDASDPATASADAPLRRGLSIRGSRVAHGPTTVLDGVDLDLPAGTITAIVGPSGVGKSTLGDVVRGAIDPGCRRYLDGAPVTMAEAAATCAWMGQEPGLVEGTVGENVALGQPRLPGAEIEHALRDAGIPEVEPDRALGVGGDGLSGGQAQRVALARAIARARGRACRVVVLDEPSSALDAARERRVAGAMRDLAASGAAVAVITHRPGLVERTDRVVRLEGVPGTGEDAHGAAVLGSGIAAEAAS